MINTSWEGTAGDFIDRQFSGFYRLEIVQKTRVSRPTPDRDLLRRGAGLHRHEVASAW
jgi:hypothetical protein